MNTAELIVACLQANGVQRIYGVPGEENTDLMLALTDSEIKFVLTRHEQSAAAMAAAEGRITGKPGVCLATLGPGASNLAAGLGTAYLDFCPVIAISGQGSTDRLHKESHQIIDTQQMLEPVSKRSVQINEPKVAAEVVAEAFRQATQERPGPVHIGLPENIAGMNVEVDAKPIKAKPQPRTVAHEISLDAAVQTIAASQRPLIIAGAGVVRDNAYTALRSLSGATGICVITTMMAMGAIEPNVDRCLHTFGTMNDDATKEAMASADCIIAVGIDPVEISPANWGHGADASIIHIAQTPAQIEASYQPCVELVGDIGEALAQVTFKLNEHQKFFDPSAFNEHREAIMAARREGRAQPSHPASIIKTMRNCIDDEARVFVGVGAHKMWMAQTYETAHPLGCMITNGYASMGMALPAAMASAIINPDIQTVAVCGDGDFLMNVQEMETAKRLGLNITVVGWFDDSYGLIRHKQEEDAERHSDLSLGNPDWSQLANAFGWHSTHVDEHCSVKDALQSSLPHPGPSLCIIPVSAKDNASL